MSLNRAIAHLKGVAGSADKRCMQNDASIGLIKLEHKLALLCMRLGQLSFQRRDSSDSNPETGHRHDSMFKRAQDIFTQVRKRCEVHST
jgi:hypothetical protein